MCFSSSASFGAGAVLAVVGTVSITQVRNPSQIALASIPLLFAVQQVAEGLLWVSIPDQGASIRQHDATYLFLLFAQVVWPTLVPLSILMMEKESRHKIILRVLTGVGLIVSVYLLYCLVTYHVEARIVGQHISYIQDYPTGLRYPGVALYILATIAPLFFSQVKKMWVLGTIITASYVVTEVFYNNYVLSVWCFLASVISIAVLLIMRNIRKHPFSTAQIEIQTTP
ncbi:MAG: DUF6629 family protein [Bacteroidota bacterium]